MLLLADMYEYTKLETGQIRVMQIQPDLHDGLLQCSLQSTVLAAAKDGFTALSWTWGNDATIQSNRPVRIDSQLLNVGPNLWAMLDALRLHNETGVLWIDAICIN